MTSETSDSSTPDPSDAREQLGGLAGRPGSPAGPPPAPPTAPIPVVAEPGSFPPAGGVPTGSVPPDGTVPVRAIPAPDAAPAPDPLLATGAIPVPATGAGPAPATSAAYPVGRPGETVYHTSGVYGTRAKSPSPRHDGDDGGRPGGGHLGGGGRHAGGGGRRTMITAIIAGSLAVVVAVVLLVVLVFKPGSSAPPKFGMIPTGPSAQQDGEQVAAAFLAAWQAHDLATAANLTDQPAAAQAALALYAKNLNLRKFGLTAGSAATAAGSTAAAPRQAVGFGVTASVAGGSGAAAVRATWAYHSSLTAYQKPGSSVWFVRWQPDVMAPNLTAATHLAAVTVPPTVSMVTDAAGGNLAGYGDAGLNNIAGLLKAAAPANSGAKAGLDVEIQTKAGTPVASSQAILTAPGNYPTLSTTIDAKAESAARTSVAMHKQSSLVAIQPSTGKILAIANNAGFNDFALTADVAPGSTMKTITSTALFNAGLVTPDTGVACPAAYTVTGITYHNDQGETLPAGTPFSEDFAQSCNNAFTQWWPHLSGKLASTAKDYYGLNQKWNIGIGTASASYFSAPADASGSELAQEAFGEGSLIASPLAMASVAATIDTGQFKQPVLTLTAKQSVTAKPLPAQTDADLKQLMRAVVTQGTGAGLGFGSTVYAKTGTADIQGQDQPNSWLIAFDPSKDIAVADLVVNAGYGAQFAGPEVASFLNALG